MDAKASWSLVGSGIMMQIRLSQINKAIVPHLTKHNESAAADLRPDVFPSRVGRLKMPILKKMDSWSIGCVYLLAEDGADCSFYFGGIIDINSPHVGLTNINLSVGMLRRQLHTWRQRAHRRLEHM